MTSIEILNLVNQGREKPFLKKHLHTQIRRIFKPEIDAQVIRAFLDSEGEIDYYTLPEVKATILVNKKDSTYLHAIIAFWVIRNQKHTKPFNHKD